MRMRGCAARARVTGARGSPARGRHGEARAADRGRHVQAARRRRGSRHQDVRRPALRVPRHGFTVVAAPRARRLRRPTVVAALSVTAAILAAAGGATAAAAGTVGAQGAGPSVAFTRILGGQRPAGARAVAVDGEGNTYVTGDTSATGFPAASLILPVHAQTAAFVVKLDASGRIVYAKVLGGDRVTSG